MNNNTGLFNGSDDCISTLFNVIEDYLFIIDYKRVIIKANRAATLNLGYSEQDLIGKPIVDLYTPEEGAIDVLAAMQAGSICRTSLRCKTGRTIPVETRLVSSCWQDEPVFFSISRDISKGSTETKEYREELSKIRFRLSEYKKLENDLRQQRSFLKSLIDSVPDFFFYKDTSGRYLGCNAAAAKHFFGMMEEVIIGKKDNEIVREEALARDFVAMDRKVLESGKACIQEETLLLADGSIMEVETIKTPFFNEYNEIAGLIGIARDVTARKRAEAALQRRVDHYVAISELSSEFSFIVGIGENGHRKREWLSGALLNITGYSQEELAHISRRTLLYPADLPKLNEALKRVMDGQPGSHECRIIHKSGEIRWIREYIYPVWNQESMRVERLYGVVKDITFEKLTEEAYIKSEKKFKDLSENSPLGLCLLQEGLIRYVNISFVILSGYQFDELVDKKSLEDFIHSEDLPLFRQEIEDSAMDKLPFCVRGINKHGNTRFWEIYKITTSYNDKPAYLCKILDITERLKMEQEKEKNQEAMARAEKVSSIATLATGLTHEINQPLNSIKLTVSGLLYWHQQGKTFETNVIMEQVQEIADAVNRIDEIIKHIRGLIRGRESAQEFCDVNSAVEYTLELLEWQLASHAITVQKSLDYGIMPILAHKTGLEEMIVNIVTNAIQALDQLGDKLKLIKIASRFDVVSNEVIIEISDNGPGINPGIKNKIFEPFFSTKYGSPNMGLGLSIVYSLISACKGRIEVENCAPQGALFRLFFPAENNRI